MTSRVHFTCDNMLWSSTSAISGRSPSTAYPLANLTNLRYPLWPGYRTADRQVDVNGSNEYCYLAHHTDFNLGTAFTIEFILRVTSLGAVFTFLDKSTGPTNLSYTLSYNTNGELIVYLSSTGSAFATTITFTSAIAIDTDYHGRVVYDGTTTSVTYYRNSVKVGYIDNAGGSDIAATQTGSIPVSLFPSSSVLSLFADNGGAVEFMPGSCSLIAISGSARQSRGYLPSTDCIARWNFQDALTDDSGNSHTLSQSGIDATNYSDCTAWQWIQLESTPNFFAASEAGEILIDRRHNVQGGSIINLWVSDNSAATDPTLLDQMTVAAGNPVIFANTNLNNKYIWLEINDPDNPDGYIEIPNLMIGRKKTLSTASFDHTTFRIEQRAAQVKNASLIGNLRTYRRSNQYWQIIGTIENLSRNESLLSPGELSTISDVADIALDQPIVLSHDNDGQWALISTHYGQLVNADLLMATMTRMKDAQNDELYSVPIEFKEFAEEANR